MAIAAILPAFLWSQSGSAFAASAIGTGAATSTPSTPVATPVSIVPPTVSLGLQATETERLFTASVSNPNATVMTVLGVQTTPGLYVSQFPRTIPAKGSAVFTLLYYSQDGVSSTSDLLRVLTDQGIQLVQIDHNRTPTVQFDSTALQWRLNEATPSKSVTFTVAAGAGTPSGVLALGTGNQAQLTAVGGGSYLPGRSG